MRYACPGSTIIEENPRPAPFTDRAVPSVPQVSICGIHACSSHSDYLQRGRWVCPGSTIIEETSQPTASTSKAAPIKAVCICRALAYSYPTHIIHRSASISTLLTRARAKGHSNPLNAQLRKSISLTLGRRSSYDISSHWIALRLILFS